jgi:hypothetical protein
MIISIPNGFGILILMAKNFVLILQLKYNQLFGVFIEWLSPME